MAFPLARPLFAAAVVLVACTYPHSARAADPAATQFTNVLASRYPNGAPVRELPTQNIGFSANRNLAYFLAAERIDLGPGGPTLPDSELYAYDRAAQSVRRVAVPSLPGSFVRRRICLAPQSDYALVEGYSVYDPTDPGGFRAQAWLANIATGQVEPLPAQSELGAYRYGGFCFANARDGSAFTFIGQLPFADGATGATFVAVLDTTQRPLRVRVCGDAKEYRNSDNQIVARSIPVQYLRESRQVVLRGTLTAPSDRSVPLSILECGNSNLNRAPVTPSPTAEVPGLVGQGLAYEQLSNDGVTASVSGFRGGSNISYVVDRVGRQVLVAPEDIAPASLPNSLSEDGRFLVVSRDRGGNRFELAVVDVGSRRVATFLLSPSLQPFEDFRGDSFQYSGDGSLISYRGGGADFAPVQPGTSNLQVYVSSNPYYADALPQKLSDLAGASTTTAVSDDGRYVLFESALANLDPTVSDGNGAVDVFLRDRDSGLLRAISVGGSPAQARGGIKPAISGDGTRIAYATAVNATRNDIVLRETASGASSTLSSIIGASAATASLNDPSLSDDGNLLAFTSSAALLAADTDAVADVYRIDLRTRELVLASAGASAACRNPRIARRGSAVAFECGGTVPAQNAVKAAPVPGAVVYLYDLIQRKFETVSKPAGTGSANGGSNIQGISNDGSRVLFGSDASNLVGGDTNGSTDLFLVDRNAGAAPQRVATQANGAQLNAPIESASLSPDGNAIAYTTRATGIDPVGGAAGTTALYLAPATGGPARQVRRGTQGRFGSNTAAPALTFDGAEVVFGSDDLSPGGTPGKAGTGSLNVANNPVVGTDSRTVSSGNTGLWFNRAQNFQGFLVESATIGGVPTALVSWYVYQGGQAAWLFGASPLAPGSTRVPLVITRGANFSPNFNPASVVTEPWGTITLKFSSPTRALFAWESSLPGFSSGIATLEKLANAADPASDRVGEMPACVGGTWYDPQQDRQGLQVQKIAGNPSQLLVLWYSYDQGRQIWLLGLGPISGDSASMTLRTYRGAQFPPDFRSTDVTERVWGTLQFTRTGNDAARIQWTPTLAGFSAGTMNLQRLSALTGRPCR